MAREFFTDINLNQNEMQFLVMHPLASAPSGGNEIEGQMYYDTIAQQPFFWNGSAWTSMSSGAASSVPFSGVTSGTNTSATMLVGGGASLSFIGLGTINANMLDGREVDAPAAQDGEFLIFTGGSVNAWQARRIIASDFPEFELNDLVDVDINAASDGDVLQYIGGSINAWSPIPASSISADLAEAVILSPTIETRNRIQPASDITALSVKAFSTNSVNIFSIINTSNETMFTIDSSDGSVNFGGNTVANQTKLTSSASGGVKTVDFPNLSGEVVLTTGNQSITGTKLFDSLDLGITGTGVFYHLIRSNADGSTQIIDIPNESGTLILGSSTPVGAGYFVKSNGASFLTDWSLIETSDLPDITLDLLIDIDVSNLQDGYVLQYFGGSIDSWVSVSSTTLDINGEAVDDRVVSLIQDGTGISWSYNDDNNILTPTISISSFNIDDLNDVVITAVGDNEVLAYDNGSGNWINQTSAEAGLVSGTALSGQVAYWSGTNTLTGSSNFTFDGTNAQFQGNITVAGDLTVSGTTTTIDTTNLIVEDNFIVINSAGITQDAGIEVERGGAGSNDNAFLRFSEIDNEWYVDNGTVAHLMARKYAEEITGDDSTTVFSILHDMGSLYVLVQVFDSSTGKQVEVDVDMFSSDRVDLSFGIAPSGGQSYRVIVVG